MVLHILGYCYVSVEHRLQNIRSNYLISTKVYRKNTNTDIYINWKSFAPDNWKWGTLKTLVTRAFHICSTDKYLKEELEHITKVFHQK